MHVEYSSYRIFTSLTGDKPPRATDPTSGLGVPRPSPPVVLEGTRRTLCPPNGPTLLWHFFNLRTPFRKVSVGKTQFGEQVNATLLRNQRTSYVSATIAHTRPLFSRCAQPSLA